MGESEKVMLEYVKSIGRISAMVILKQIMIKVDMEL